MRQARPMRPGSYRCLGECRLGEDKRHGRQQARMMSASCSTVHVITIVMFFLCFYTNFHCLHGSGYVPPLGLLPMTTAVRVLALQPPKFYAYSTYTGVLERQASCWRHGSA